LGISAAPRAPPRRSLARPGCVSAPSGRPTRSTGRSRARRPSASTGGARRP